MKDVNNVLYRIKNILFILFLLGFIKLLPNIKEIDVFGTIIIILVIIFSIIMFYCYGVKDKNLNSNSIQNFLTILLYIYVFIVSCKYTQSINNNLNSISNLYFIINYIIIVISMIGVSANNIVILRQKNKNII